MRTASTVALVGIVLVQGACASLVHGTTQTIPVTSSPTGATVAVDSVPVGRTPLKLSLARKRPHVVTVASDNGVSVDVALARTLSAWVWGNITMYGLPAVVDVRNGAAFRLDPDSLHVVLAANALVADGAKPGLTVAGGNKVRMRTNDSPGQFVYATVDSANASRLVVRTSVDSVSEPSSVPAIVAESDVHRLDFVEAPERRVTGQLAMRFASLGSLAVGAVVGGDLLGTLFLGGIYNVGVIPLSYALGYAGGVPRWSPREAHRIGSSLRVGDRVRVRQAASPTRISGRFVDLDGTNMLIVVKRDTLRVARAGLATVERRTGLDLGSAVLFAAGVGAAIGLADPSLGSYAVTPGERAFAVFGGAFFALYSFPAFAPRRWVNVLKF